MEKIVMYYMYENSISTKITVTGGRNIEIENYTDDITKRAFGIFEQPTQQQLFELLEYRCFPRDRFNARELIRDAGLDCYDPFQIVKITHGVMVDDVFWIRFEGEELTWDDVNPRRYL